MTSKSTKSSQAPIHVVQRLPIGRFHDLKASEVRWVNPTCMVDHAFREHSAVEPETVINGFGITVLEVTQHD